MNNVSFQIVDISSDDIPDDNGKKQFTITLYGINEYNKKNSLSCY